MAVIINKFLYLWAFSAPNLIGIRLLTLLAIFPVIWTRQHSLFRDWPCAHWEPLHLQRCQGIWQGRWKGCSSHPMRTSGRRQQCVLYESYSRFQSWWRCSSQQLAHCSQKRIMVATHFCAFMNEQCFEVMYLFCSVLKLTCNGTYFEDPIPNSSWWSQGHCDDEANGILSMKEINLRILILTVAMWDSR